MFLKTNQLNFTLKLLLGQSVVLVEYPGHEPQLFVPALLDNAIVLQNFVFDYEAPLLNQQSPNLHDRKTTMPVKNTSTHSGHSEIRTKPKRSHKRHSSGGIGGSGVSSITVNSSSFQWVRTGGSTGTNEHRLTHKRDNDDVSFSSPAIAPATTANEDKQISKQPWKSDQMQSTVKNRVTPYFDAVRKFYLDNNQKSGRYLPPVRKQLTSTDLARSTSIQQFSTQTMPNLNFKS